MFRAPASIRSLPRGLARLTEEKPVPIFTFMGEYSLDDTLIALADATRRAILGRLSRGEARVTELAEPFDISLNSVSKHIRILERAHLVRRRKVGRDHFLTYDSRPLVDVEKWITTQRALWNARLDQLDAILLEEDRVAATKRKRRSR